MARKPITPTGSSTRCARFKLIPDLIRKIDAAYPPAGAAPPPPPLAEVAVIERKGWMAPLAIAFDRRPRPRAATYLLVG